MIDSARLLSSKILIIDDNIENVQLTESLLEYAGYVNVQAVTNAATALNLFQTFEPDLVILDLNMPGVSGYEILKEFQARDSEIPLPILVFCADSSQESRRHAIKLGASDFLTKPSDATELLLRVENCLRVRYMHQMLRKDHRELEAKIQHRTQELANARLETLECLAKAGEYRDDFTGEHTMRVGELSAAIAEHMHQEPGFVEMIRHAAPLHDIGKIGIPDAVLLKPGPLTEEEHDVMKQHVQFGAKILSQANSPILIMATEIALYHHERWDGNGYLRGLSGTEIPLPARIVSVADTFDALTNNRPYRKGISHGEAIEKIKAGTETLFDPEVVAAFVALMEELEEEQQNAAA